MWLMILKGRTESEELLKYRYLNMRMEMTEKEKFKYSNLEKGYEGEKKFDMLASRLQEERYHINDLLLEVNGSYFQIDSFIISQGVIHLLDIKYFYGDCYIESDKLYAVTTGREYKNPLIQLNRSATLFRQLLQYHKLNYIVDPYVIFINPEFTLLQAPMNQPFILPTQVNRFLNDINKLPSKLNDDHMKLAQKMISLHQTKNPYVIFPEYEYDQMQKGNYCIICGSFHIVQKKSILVCGKCDGHEKIETAVLRNVKEFMLLFPERRITTQSIHEWCKVDISTKTVCRILKKNYTAFGNTRDTYFE
jgi:hypothetical protein